MSGKGGEPMVGPMGRKVCRKVCRKMGGPMPWTSIAALVVLAGLWGCATTVGPGSATYRPLPFLSKVTITGGDIPGPLRVRESSLRFAAGGTTHAFSEGATVEAVYHAWINGHGQFIAHWERDGQVVDRVNVFITYGDTLEVHLAGAPSLPATEIGSHTVHFVVEAPEEARQTLELTYEVQGQHG
jgi:hypothetical protein